MATLFERAYLDWIRSRARLTALLGEGEAMRFYFGTAPQGGRRPYVVWSILGQPPHDHMGGPSALESPTLLHDTYGDDALATKAVVAALDEELRAVHHERWGDVGIRRIFRAAIVDLPELRGDGSQAATQHTRSEYLAWYSR